VKSGDPETRRLGAELMAATKLVTAKSPEAAAAVDALETSLMNAIKAMRLSEAAGVTKVSVDFRKLLLDWHAAQKEAVANIVALGDAYLNDEEVREDPRFDMVEDAVSDLATIVPAFGDQLDTDINAILNDGGKNPDLIRQGIATINSYRAKLESATELSEVEKVASADLGGDFRVVVTLTEAIDKISASLSKIAA
jgi:hypothetical protein